MNMKSLNKMILCGLATVAASVMVNGGVGYAAPFADAGASAGVQLNQLEQAIAQARLEQAIAENRNKKASVVKGTTKANQDKQKNDIKFKLQKVNMDKSRVLTNDEISNITKQYINKDIVIDDVYKMIDKINALYAKKGYITCRVFLEPQTVKSGIIKLTLIEGEVYKNVILGTRSTKDEYILDRLHTKPGTIPNIKQLNKDLLRFNANNNLQLSVTLKPGAKPNTTEVVLEAKEQKQQSGTVFSDNAGNESTGIYRGGLFYTVNNIAGRQDNWTLGTVMSKGTWAFSTNYSTPIGLSGAKLNFGYSTNSIHTVQSPEDMPYDYIRGHASSYSIGFSQPVVINERTRSYVTFDLNRQNSKNAIYSGTWYQPWQDTTITDGTLGFNMINYGDSWVAYQRHGFILGRGQADANSGDGNDSAKYGIYKFNGFYQKAYQHGQTINFRFEAQKSWRDDLPSARGFFIGGMNTVRGYAENYMGGDSGFDLSFEYQFPMDLARQINGFLFYDYGTVFGESAESHNGDRSLASVGLGVKGNIGKNYYASLVLGCPIYRIFGNKEDYVSRARVHFMLGGTF